MAGRSSRCRISEPACLLQEPACRRFSVSLRCSSPASRLLQTPGSESENRAEQAHDQLQGIASSALARRAATLAARLTAGLAALLSTGLSAALASALLATRLAARAGLA